MIGRSHEEPVFGSGNIFDLNSDCLPTHKTSHVRHTQNTDNSNRVSDQTIDCQLKCHQRLVRSSSIDTMQALMSDPSVNAVRLMHTIPQPLTPPVPAPRRTLRPMTTTTFNKVYVNHDVLHRTQSLDEPSANSGAGVHCSENRCSHCSECLIDFNQSSDDFDIIFNFYNKSLNNNNNNNNSGDKCEQKCGQSVTGQAIDLLTGNESKDKNTCAEDLFKEIFNKTLSDGNRDTNQSISCDLYDSNTNTSSLSSVVANVGQKSQQSHQSHQSASNEGSDVANSADRAADACHASRLTTGSDQSRLKSSPANDDPNVSSNIDLLKEFDICFNSVNNQNNNYSIETNSVRSTASYEYDSIELQNESIVKKASIGVADLNNTDSTSEVPIKQFDLICLSEEPEEVLQSLSKCRRGPLCMDSKCITIKRRIGNGYFGDVYLATIPCSTSAAVIQLAVKMLKTNASQQQKADFLREAQVMSRLVHKHIVRLIGVCCGEPFMLCMELAPLGPLNRYLITDAGRQMTTHHLLQLMLQVSKAMNYLCGQNFVHRDLAARNVLLVTENLAKVSDFGMSRAVEPQHDYYRASRASKWPLKWYAPECIYYYKFTHKSDVWSYGITLWEVMARGCMPYQGMDGQEILRMIKDNKRLAKPDNCPVIIYQLMWNCWQFNPEDRPTFQQICDRLESNLSSGANSGQSAANKS